MIDGKGEQSGCLRAVAAVVADLQAQVDEELARGAEYTTRLTALDAVATAEYARVRAAFAGRLAAGEAKLAEAVATAAQTLGLGAFEPAEIERLHPGPGGDLRSSLRRLAAAAAMVRRQDVLNRELALRARACVAGWLRALGGAPAAYDRRGAFSDLPAYSTAVRVA